MIQNAYDSLRPASDNAADRPEQPLDPATTAAVVAQPPADPGDPNLAAREPKRQRKRPDRAKAEPAAGEPDTTPADIAIEDLEDNPIPLPRLPVEQAAAAA